jgi:hypothetical protein
MAVINTPSSVSSLPNGTLINGVANFYTSTKPTVRVDGSALVAGDRWYNIATRESWFWNGTYWLSQEKYLLSYGNVNNTASPSATAYPFPRRNIFLESVTYSVLLGNVNNSTDYYTVQARLQTSDPPSGGSAFTIATFSTQGEPPSSFYTSEQVINSAFISTSTTGTALWNSTSSILTTFGAPTTNGHARFTYAYRIIAP